VSGHWFDRMALRAAEGEAFSRRSAFKGVAVGAFAASALNSPQVARAARHVEAKASESACRGCVFAVADSNNRQVLNCYKTGGKASRFAKPKPKPAPPPKKPAVPSADTIACILQVHAHTAVLLALCRTKECQNDPLPPIEGNPSSPAPGESTGCPVGTNNCPGTPLCCYGSDLCCGCAAAGGTICCAGVIGCTCC
jgi:hypothetical protein